MSVRVVLDSNVVLSALLFSTGRLSWLRIAWQAGAILPLASRETLDELIRVLGYPKFRLDVAEITALLGDYVPFVVTVAVPREGLGAPSAPDPDDQKFLDLAMAGNAAWVVTGDRALLTVTLPEGKRVVSPGVLRELLGA